MGAGKTGRFLCSEWLGDDVKPDMITIGKSITGGAYPAAFVLGNNETMSLVKPYQCAGTFAQTPMAIACTTAALKIIDEEGLVERATNIQDQFLKYTKEWAQNFAFVDFVTARGADFNITLQSDYHNALVTARRFAALAMHKGLVTYPLEERIRMSIAMTITDEALQRGFEILRETAEEIEQYEKIAGGVHETE
jgi:ornithine--oxo-acid transaminase